MPHLTLANYRTTLAGSKRHLLFSFPIRLTVRKYAIKHACTENGYLGLLIHALDSCKAMPARKSGKWSEIARNRKK